MATEPPVAVQIGKFQLRGKTAQFVARAILVALVIGIAYMAPRLGSWPMRISAMGWVAFSVYWSIAARNSAHSKSAESAESRRVHVLLINVGQLLLFIPLPGLRQDFMARSLGWAAAGLAIQASSIALAVWARRHLGRNWSGRIEIKEDHELVRTGPYRILRHPIYTAVVGMCVGTALVDGQVHALIGVVMVVGAYWRKIHMEETNLRTAFGSRYEDYRRATWGLVPGLF